MPAPELQREATGQGCGRTGRVKGGREEQLQGRVGKILLPRKSVRDAGMPEGREDVRSFRFNPVFRCK